MAGQVTISLIRQGTKQLRKVTCCQKKASYDKPVQKGHRTVEECYMLCFPCLLAYDKPVQTRHRMVEKSYMLPLLGRLR